MQGQGSRRQDLAAGPLADRRRHGLGLDLTTIPRLNLIYYGTGNPGPWNANQRPGDNLWTTTIFARDPDTGAAKWAYQINPHDLCDYDEINENILLDLPINGQTRKVLVHIGRNGYMYVIDRADRRSPLRRRLRHGQRRPRAST